LGDFLGQRIRASMDRDEIFSTGVKPITSKNAHSTDHRTTVYDGLECGRSIPLACIALAGMADIPMEQNHARHNPHHPLADQSSDPHFALSPGLGSGRSS
jgi:hypothetical protein